MKPARGQDIHMRPGQTWLLYDDTAEIDADQFMLASILEEVKIVVIVSWWGELLDRQSTIMPHSWSVAVSGYPIGPTLAAQIEMAARHNTQGNPGWCAIARKHWERLTDGQ